MTQNENKNWFSTIKMWEIGAKWSLIKTHNMKLERSCWQTIFSFKYFELKLILKKYELAKLWDSWFEHFKI